MNVQFVGSEFVRVLSVTAAKQAPSEPDAPPRSIWTEAQALVKRAMRAPCAIVAGHPPLDDQADTATLLAALRWRRPLWAAAWRGWVCARTGLSEMRVTWPEPPEKRRWPGRAASSAPA